MNWYRHPYKLGISYILLPCGTSLFLQRRGRVFVFRSRGPPFDPVLWHLRLFSKSVPNSGRQK